MAREGFGTDNFFKKIPGYPSQIILFGLISQILSHDNIVFFIILKPNNFQAVIGCWPHHFLYADAHRISL